MKRILSFIILIAVFASYAFAQDYNLIISGVAKNGDYIVQVTTVLDKKQYKEADDYLKKLAVDGIMFRGAGASAGLSAQKPLITDPSVRRTKAEFFDAFNLEKLYLTYASVTPSSVVSTQLPKKKYEVKGIVTVRKEDLLHFLEQNGIVKGMGNLW